MTEEMERKLPRLFEGGEEGLMPLTIVLLWLVVGLHDLLKLLLRIRGHLNQRNAMGKCFFYCFLFEVKYHQWNILLWLKLAIERVVHLRFTPIRGNSERVASRRACITGPPLCWPVIVVHECTTPIQQWGRPQQKDERSGTWRWHNFLSFGFRGGGGKNKNFAFKLQPPSFYSPFDPLLAFAIAFAFAFASLLGT